MASRSSALPGPMAVWGPLEMRILRIEELNQLL
jgi:hypothetical protein